MDNGKLKKSVTLDDLAIMVAKGFEGTATKTDIVRLEGRMGGLEGRMDKLEGRMGGLEIRMDKLDGRMEGLANSVNNYLELSDKRYLELKSRQNIIVSWVQKIAEKTGVAIDVAELDKKS